MNKSHLMLLTTLGFLSGCAQLAPPKPIVENQRPINSLDLQVALNSQQQLLSNELAEQYRRHSFALTDLKKQLALLTIQQAQMNTAQAAPVVIEPPVKKPEPVQREQVSDDKLMLGEVEFIYVDELGQGLPTRIDTGAESSSLDASNIIEFERDGQRWIKFDVYPQGRNNPAKEMRAPLSRYVRIKQDARSEPEKRPVIRVHLKIGSYHAQTDLNLTDRSHLEYPLLLGRQFMKDIAIVDVSQKYIHGQPNYHLPVLPSITSPIVKPVEPLEPPVVDKSQLELPAVKTSEAITEQAEPEEQAIESAILEKQTLEE